MTTRYCFGGDEHIFVEVDEAMSLEAFFKSLSITTALREENIRGVTEICPANASFNATASPPDTGTLNNPTVRSFACVAR